MAESKPIKSEDIVDSALFVQAKKNTDEWYNSLIVLKQGLLETEKAAANTLKLNKDLNNTAQIKESTAALTEHQKTRVALAYVTEQEAKAKQELIKLDKLEKASKKELTDEQVKELGTLEKLAYQNRKLAEERRKLNLETANGKKRLSEINTEIDKNNKSIRENTDSLYKQRLNIGNYQSALNGLPRAFNLATEGAVQFGQGIKALLLNPVVLIISAISAALYGLFKAFTSTDSGAKEFASLMEGISGIIDVLRQRTILIIESLKDLFNGDYTEAANKFKESITGVGDELTRTAKSARDYIFALDEIEDSENNYISKRAENQRRIAELEFKAADRSLTIKQRKEALIEAIKLSEEDFAKTRDIARAKFIEELKYFADKNKLNRLELKEFITASDEQQKLASKDLKRARENNEDKFKSLEEMYAKILQADTDYFNENKRNNAKITAFDEQVKKDNEERRKKQLEDQKKYDELVLKEYDRLIDESNKKFKKDTDNFLNENKKKWDAIIKLNEDNLNLLLENNELEAKLNKDKVAQENARFQKELNQFKIQLDEKGNITEESKRHIELIEKQHQKNLDDIIYDSEKLRIQSTINDTEKITKAYSDELNKREKLQQDKLDKEIQNRQKAIDRQVELAKNGLNNQLAYEEMKLEKDQLKKKELQEKAAKQQEIIQLTQAYMNAYNAELQKAGANPTQAATKALGDVLLAKGIAKGLVQFFAEGTDYVDGPGTETSDSIPAMLSKGEAVIPAKQNKQNRDAVKALVDGSFQDMFLPKYEINQQGSFADNIANSIIIQQNKEITKLLKDIANKPVQQVDVDGFKNFVETLYYEGKKDVIIHKSKTRI